MPFYRREPIRPAFVVPPAESRDLAATEAEIESIDRRLLALQCIPRASRSASMWPREVDRLLDLRNAIRPARVTAPADVPVIPGRSS